MSLRIINFFDGFGSDVTPTSQAIAAADISVTPVGNLTQTNVQSALEVIYTAHIDLSAGVHGVAGSVVGTTDAQVLTNKTFAGHLLAQSDSTYDVGASGTKWRNGNFSGNINLDGNVNAGGQGLFGTLAVQGKLVQLNLNGDDATSEGSGFEVDRTSVNGSLIYDSTMASRWKAGDKGSEIQLANISSVQTFTNKVIDADSNTITNIENADIKVGANIARSKTALGTANYALINDPSGVLSEEQYLNRTRGGTGITSTATFPASGVIVTRDANETLTNKTLASPIISGGSMDVPGATSFNLLASIGANTLQIGGATSTVVIPGILQTTGSETRVNSTNLEVTDKNIIINKGGNAASMTDSGITVDNTEGTDGSLIYDSSTASKWKGGEAGSEVEIVNVSGTQTLTNKTLTSPVLNVSATGTAVLDDDTFATASDTTLATSESIKAYADSLIAASTFTSLTDTPANYTSANYKVVRVNNTPDALEYATLTQTANQVLISNGVGTVTFSLPQDIHTAANPAFAGVTRDSADLKFTTTTSGDVELNPVSNISRINGDTVNNSTNLDVLYGSDGAGVDADNSAGMRTNSSGVMQYKDRAGNWTSFSAATGANTALSNLTNPTSVNQSLIFDSDNTRDVGSDTNEARDVWAHRIAHSDAGVADLNIQVLSSNGSIVLDPHGTGNIKAGSDIIPVTNNAFDLGLSTFGFRKGWINQLHTFPIFINDNYTILDNDGYTLLVVNTINKAITLPTAANNKGRIIAVMKGVSGNGTVTVGGGVLSYGTVTLDFQYEIVILQSTGSNWLVLNHENKSCRYTMASTASGWTGTANSYITVYKDIPNNKSTYQSWRAYAFITGSTATPVINIQPAITNFTSWTISCPVAIYGANTTNSFLYGGSAIISLYASVGNTAWNASGEGPINGKPPMVI